MTIAAHLAALATAGGLSFTWLMGKLQIAQVAPPTASYVLVQMSLDAPLPPPPPPAPPPGGTPQEDRQDDPEDKDPPPLTYIEEVKPPPKRQVEKPGTGSKDSTGDNPFGVPGVGPGIPGVNRIAGLQPVKLVTAPQRTEQRAPVPLSAVRAQAIYTPDPSQDRLAATRAGMFDKRSGDNVTAFCVDATGRTTEIRTVKPFPGDPGVDEVIRATIKTWRFKPFMVEGKAIKTCTSQEFRITFK